MHDHDDGIYWRSADGIRSRPHARWSHGGWHGAHPPDDMGRRPALLGGVPYVTAAAVVGLRYRRRGIGAGKFEDVFYRMTRS